MSSTQLAVLVLAGMSLGVPLVGQLLLRLRPGLSERLRELWQQKQRPTQEDFLIGFPLFIVFCGILMGWMLLFIGIVRQGMLR